MTIINDIIMDVSNISFKGELLSLSLVGSFVDDSHKIEKFNDIDFVFVFEKVSTDLMVDIKNKINTKIIEIFSTDQIEVLPLYKIGPTKITKKNKCQIMLHCLIYDLESLNRETPLALFSWKNDFKHLSGKYHLNEIIQVNEISTNDVIHEPCGIADCKQSIIDGKVGYYEWDSSKDEFVKRSLNLSGDNYVEFLLYSVYNSAKNALQVHGHKYPNHVDICNQFENEFRKLKSVGHLKKCMDLKKRIRARKESLDEKKIEILMKETIDFLNELEEAL